MFNIVIFHFYDLVCFFFCFVYCHLHVTQFNINTSETKIAHKLPEN